MARTLTAEDFRTDSDFNTSTGLLFDWDSHGYEIAYYVAVAYGTYDDADVFHIDRLENGEPMIREHTGEALCGGCATRYLAENTDAVVTSAHQINGEIGDSEPVMCDDCGGTIYAPYRQEEAG